MKIPAKISSRVLNAVAGVHVHLLSADEVVISWVQLKLNKGRIEQEASGSDIKEFSGLSQEIKAGTTVWLGISGRGVISRKLTAEIQGEIIHALLPNAKSEEFAVTEDYVTQHERFASAIRQSKLDEIAESIEEQGFPVVGFSLGTSFITPMITHGLIRDGVLKIPFHTLQINDAAITEITTAEDNEESIISLQGEEIKSSLILPFALSYNFLTSEAQPPAINRFADAFESYVFKKLTRFLLIGALGSIFLILLINFLVFSNTNQKVSKLSQEMSVHSVYFAKRDSLRKELTLKKKLIEESGLSANTVFGMYADRIASGVPSGIILNQMSFSPVQNKIKEDEPIRFGNNLHINGSSNGSIVLNDWVNKMEEYNWIKNITVVNYRRVEDKGEFELEIDF